MSQVLSMMARRTVVGCQQGDWHGQHTWRGALQGVMTTKAGFSDMLWSAAGASEVNIFMGACPG